MTRKQIRNAVAELRDTLHRQWGDGSTYRLDNTHLRKLASLAYKAATLERGMEAKDCTILCLRDEIRRLRPELKDCIAGRGLALQSGQTIDPGAELIKG